jgi:6-phosphogluconolactonase (cycloisomerase 2 family)
MRRIMPRASFRSRSRAWALPMILPPLALVLSACGGGGAGGQSYAPAAAEDTSGASTATSSASSSAQGSSGNAYTVGGTVAGLTGAGLVLEINGGQALPVSGNGAITFPSPLADGSQYVVTVQSQSNAYREICGVSNGSGNVSGANVSSVVINCSTVLGFLYETVGNQILSYGISPGTGAPVPFGVPVATADVAVGTTDRATAMVTSPNGAFLYVSNILSAGLIIDPTVSSSISVYGVDSGSGALTPTGSVAISGGMQPYGMSMSSSGFLFVYGTIIQGTPPNQSQSWTLTTYSVDASSGALTPSGTTLTFNSQISFATTTDGQRLYLMAGDLSPFDAPSPVTVTAYTIAPTTGALTAGPTLNLTSSWASNDLNNTMAIDPLGRYLYLTAYSYTNPIEMLPAASVLTYAIDPSTGALTALATGTPVPSNAGGLVADPSGKYLYMLDSLNFNASWDGVMALAVDQTSGTVTPIGSQLAVSGQPGSALCDPSGQFLYVGNGDGGAVSMGGSPWANLAAFTISTAPTTAGQLVPSGIGTLETTSNPGSGLVAVVE